MGRSDRKRKGSAVRALAAVLAGLSSAGLGDVLGASEGAYRFRIPTADAEPGDPVRVTVEGEHERSAQGFSFALAYPPDLLAIESVHTADTILEAIGTDTFEVLLKPEEGILAVGVLVDARPPFTGALIPAIGFPLDFVHIEAVVSEDAREDVLLRFDDALLVPPVRNLYVVENESVPVAELGEGRIRVLGRQALRAGFVRGDANMDGAVDVSDPLGILGYVFLGKASPKCREAADSNDDGEIDVSDAVYTLAYLFSGGPPPPPPNAPEAEYEDRGSLGCQSPLPAPPGD
ncbi:MAG: dockerin type I repeat-containing protein [Planctomycetota bacterium]